MAEKNCNKEIPQHNSDYKLNSGKCKIRNEAERCKSNNELSEPTMNSALRHLRYMKELKNKQYSKSLNNMLMKSVVVKTSNKLNFDAAHTVFKNLISININDSLLLPEKKISIQKKYSRPMDKIPLPELCDFLEPIPAHSHYVPEPPLKLQFSHSEFDVCSAYSRFIA